MNKHYLQVLNKIENTIWLITPESLDSIMRLVESKLNGDTLSDTEVDSMFAANHGNSDGIDNGIEVFNGVAVLPISGPIFGKANLMTQLSGATSLEQFKSDFVTALNDSRVDSILLRVDSPGGTVDMVQEVADEIRTGREQKPVYGIADGMAGSAAYWLLSQCERVYSTPSGMVGSIGAYTVHKDQSAADAASGTKFTYISAGPYKTEGNPHEPLTEEGRAYTQELINETYEEFVAGVADGRGFSSDHVKSEFGGGRMLLPKSALAKSMIDGVSTYDNLLTAIANQPRRIQVQVPISTHAGVTSYKTTTAVLSGNGVFKVESADLEHSEPGGGGPRQGNLDDSNVWKGMPVTPIPPNVNDDPAIANGWRRDPLPAEYYPDVVPPVKGDAIVSDRTLFMNFPTVILPNEGGEMDTEQIATIVGLPDSASEDEIVAKVKALSEESEALKSAVAISAEERSFAEQYPAVWKEHQALLETNRANAAISFVDSIKIFSTPDGDGLKPSNMGLSSLAMDILTQAHQKFATGTAGLADFEDAIKAITQGGFLEYGERGSNQAPDLPAPYSTETREGIMNTRKLFAEKISEIQTSDNLSYSDALAEATKKYPELASAYRNAVPAA